MTDLSLLEILRAYETLKKHGLPPSVGLEIGTELGRLAKDGIAIPTIPQSKATDVAANTNIKGMTGK